MKNKPAYFYTEKTITLDFGVQYCDSSKKLLESEIFLQLITNHINFHKQKNTNLFTFLKQTFGEEQITQELADVAKLLMVMSKEEVFQTSEQRKLLIGHEAKLIEFVESFYSYWRKFERYAEIKSNDHDNSLQDLNFSKATNDFKNLVLKVYRRIEENLMDRKHNVYRDVEAGINAGVITKELSTNVYDNLKNINFIEQITLRPPFITYPKQNTRKGFFTEVFSDPIANLNLNKDEFFCYPAKVGPFTTFVYFSKKYMAHGLSLANLFQIIPLKELENVKPEIILVFGAKTNVSGETNYFFNQGQNVHVGLVSDGDEIDYFGYMKKMILTLHNVRQISMGNLPIHGAMANIKLTTGQEKNIIIVGDSGAGKSETLEMLQTKFDSEISAIKIIFDDMGTLSFDNGIIKAYGTEIGAFVRLDDLDSGYAYRELDRAIFMNPDKINSRLVIPISNYEDIMAGFSPDMIVYANNYTDEQGIKHLIDKKSAIAIFKQGRRGAKGTTSEIGIVDSYFANPFGPHQMQSDCDILIDQYFEKLTATIKIGELYTKLSLPGHEKSGPEFAANEIMKFIKGTDVE